MNSYTKEKKMARNKNTQIDTIMLDLQRRCAGNAALESMASMVEDEFRRIFVVDSDVKNPESRRINKILRASRGLETGMKTFLLKYNNCPTELKHQTMGGFMDSLLHPATGATHRPLPSPVYDAVSVRDGCIRKKRNEYLHQAGVYPTITATDRYIESVFQFYATILSLA